MDQDFMLGRQRGKDIQTAARAGNGQVPHGGRAEGADTLLLHFIFSPEGTVKRQDLAGGQQLADSAFEAGQAGQKHKASAGGFVEKAVTEVMARRQSAGPGESR